MVYEVVGVWIGAEEIQPWKFDYRENQAQK